MPDVDAASCMAVAMARQIQDGDLVVHGGLVPLAGAAIQLARATAAPRMDFYFAGRLTPNSPDPRGQWFAGQGSIDRPGFVSYRRILDWELQGRVDLQFIRPLQVDPHGDVNASLIGALQAPRKRFHALAVADAMDLVKRPCLYVTEHSPRVFTDPLDFVTGRGHSARDGRRSRRLPARGPACVVSPLGVMTFPAPSFRMRVDSLFPGVTMEELTAATGFELGPASERHPTTLTPTPEELDALDEVDPQRLRELEFKDRRGEARRRMAGKVTK